MERLRRLVDAGQIHRQVLEEASSSERLAWLKKHGLPKKRCACEEEGSTCWCKNEEVHLKGSNSHLFNDERDNLPRFYQ